MKIYFLVLAIALLATEVTPAPAPAPIFNFQLTRGGLKNHGANKVFAGAAPDLVAGRCDGENSRSTAVDDAFMQAAAMSALAGVRLGHGGPFGAAVVRGGVIISCAHNMVLHRCDPTCHAEMNAIQQACQALSSHDLSECELYTTCEPCPMCWGAVQWSRLGKIHIGVDRNTAAKYGFDDKVFYDEIDAQSGSYRLRRFGDASGKLHSEKNMVDIQDGVLREQCADLFSDPTLNHTLRRRFSGPGGEQLVESYKAVFGSEVPPSCQETPVTIVTNEEDVAQHERLMKLAIACAKQGARNGQSKEREPFGAIIVRDGSVIAEAHNTVFATRDATATAEVNAIRSAAARLGTHVLEGCEMYSTAQPDLMSLGATLWARIPRVYCGVTQQFAARSGFEEGFLHFKVLVEVEVEKRSTCVVRDVASLECENIFKEWADRNGAIY